MRKALLIVCVVVLAGCAGVEGDDVPNSTLLDGKAPDIVTQVSVSTHAFDPGELTLDDSEAFEIINADDEPLRVVGERGTDQVYDTGTLFAGETTIIAFSEPGRYTFTERDHEGPTLEVTVNPTADG